MTIQNAKSFLNTETNCELETDSTVHFPLPGPCLGPGEIPRLLWLIANGLWPMANDNHKIPRQGEEGGFMMENRS